MLIDHFQNPASIFMLIYFNLDTFAIDFNHLT